MNNPCRTLLTEMAAELDWSHQRLMDNRKATHPLADRARVLLDKPEPQPLPDNYIDPGHNDHDRELLEIFYVACQSEGGTADEIILRGIKAVLAQHSQHPAAGEVDELMEGLKLISDGMSAIGHESDSWFVARAAALLQHQHPQPVAVSERLPGAEDCEAGECWAWDTAAESWNRTHYALCNEFTYWLPAHALPTPEAQP